MTGPPRCPRAYGIRCTICPLDQCLKENPMAIDGDWQTRASCANADPDAFVPVGKGARVSSEVWRTCTHCPVAQECFNHAMRRGIDDGVWGGSTPRMRRRMKLGDKAPALRRCDCGRRLEKPRAQRCNECAHERELERERGYRQRNQEQAA